MEIILGLVKTIFLIIFVLFSIIVILLIRKYFINKCKEKEDNWINPNNSQITECHSKLQSYRYEIEELKKENKKRLKTIDELEKELKDYKYTISEIVNIQKIILEKNENINSNFINSYLNKKISSISLSLFMLSIVLKPNYKNINLLNEIDNIITIANSKYKADDFINKVYELGKLIAQYVQDVLEIKNDKEVAIILLEVSNIIKNECYSISIYVPKPYYAHFDINTMETDMLKQGQLVNKVITWGVTIDNIEYKPFVR